jgi:integrase
MASIQRIKSPLTGELSYRAQVRVKGRPSESKTFTNQKDAKAWAAALEVAISDNRNFPGRRAQRTGFAELIQRYRDTVLKDVRASHKATRAQHLDWWEQHFIGRTLAEITPDEIAKARDLFMAQTFTRGKERKDKDGKVIPPKEYKRTGATTNRYLATLSHLFTVAWKEWRLVQSNPLREITKKKEARGRVRFLSDAERDALFDACSKSDWPALHTLVLMAISTGARRGELIKLKWADVDLKAARVIVHETKNGDPRVLPLVGKALTALRELKLQAGVTPWVFQQPSGFPGPFEAFDSHWYQALEAAGIRDFRFHDLRHTTASYLAANGASLLEIADTLGHRTLAMVRRYSHLTQTHKVAAIERMAKERGL